jgi:hypothetical protein
MAVTYCRAAAASSETGFVSVIRKSGNRFSEKIMLHQHARRPNQSFGASFRLDIGLANDAAVLVLLPQMGGQTGSSPRKAIWASVRVRVAH